VKENDDWKSVAPSTIENWISKIEDTSYEIYKASESTSSKRVTSCNDILLKLAVKGNREQISEEDEFDIIKTILKIGKTIFDALEAKKLKEADNRKAALEKAARKRELVEISKTAGRKDAKSKKMKNKEEVEEDDDDDDGEKNLNNYKNEDDDEHVNKKRRRHRRTMKTSKDKGGKDEDSQEEHEHGIFKGLSKMFAESKPTADPGMILAIESAKANQEAEKSRQEEQKTKQLELKVKLPQLNVPSSLK
jgi:hypothetical protein